MAWRARLWAVFSVILLVAGAAPAASPPPARGTGGAVASAAPLATEAGLAILGQGGNAADAAVATALALAVVFPQAGNLGGGGFAVVRMGETVESLDFRETAPAAATPDMYLDEGGEPVRLASLVGPLAAGVPGAPAGLHELHRRHGRLPWKDVVEPARRLAAEGFAVDEALARDIADHRELFARFPETAAVWLPGGEALAAGSRLVLPDLAATLAAYAERGPGAIHEGTVAQAVEEVSRRHGGILTAADMAGYRAAWRTPIRFEAFGWNLASMSLPSSGGIILGQSLRLLEDLGWQEKPRFGADRAHLLAEVLRLAFADRYLLGDPETSAATPEELLAPVWLERRRAEIRPDRAAASDSVRWWPGTPRPGVPGAEEPGETTHLSVVDGEGGLVALTTTLNGYFGCGLWVPGAGFFLNNEMDDFAAAPGKPNMFGLVQGAANAVRPGRRMLSSMSPTVAWRTEAESGAVEALALGGRGGSRIPTNTLQVLLNVLVDGDGLQAALSRPRIHHQWLPDRLQAEPDALSPETRSVLEERGHQLEITPATAKVQAVRLLPGGGVEAATDPRSEGLGAAVRPRSGAAALPWERLSPPADLPTDRPLRAGFLVVDGVYNSELMAPYDILHHTVFHTQPGIEVFTVSPGGEDVVSFEGLTIAAHHSFETAPEIDVLVVPSAEHSMGEDLENEAMMAWVRAVGGRARWVISLCDGAFVLAAAGLLDGRAATTFPGDQDRFAEMFPEIDLRRGPSFVHDGPAITSQGGAKSYDPAMYLVDHLYGEKVARGVGRGLIIAWPPRPEAMPAVVVAGPR